MSKKKNSHRYQMFIPSKSEREAYYDGLSYLASQNLIFRDEPIITSESIEKAMKMIEEDEQFNTVDNAKNIKEDN